MQTHGRCPECGKLIILSFYAVHGGVCGVLPCPDIARRMAWGMYLAGVSAIVGAAGWSIMFLLQNRVSPWAAEVFGYIWIAIVMAMAIGLSMMLHPSPETRIGPWRRVSYVAAWLLNFGWMFWAFMSLITIGSSPMWFLVGLALPLVWMKPLWDARSWAKWIRSDSSSIAISVSLSVATFVLLVYLMFVLLGSELYAWGWLNGAVLVVEMTLVAQMVSAGASVLLLRIELRRRFPSQTGHDRDISSRNPAVS